MLNFVNNWKVSTVHALATWGTVEIGGNWIDTTDYNHVVLMCVPDSDLNGDVTVAVYAASDSAGTGAEQINASTSIGTFENGTDDGDVGVIEIREKSIPSDKPYVTLYVTQAANDEFSSVMILGQAYENPVDNSDLAFAVTE